jgi:hypothetical protein
MATKLPAQELCVAKSFSLKRGLLNAIRLKSQTLGVSMSAYLSGLVCADLAGDGFLPRTDVINNVGSPRDRRGVVVPGFDLEDD